MKLPKSDAKRCTKLLDKLDLFAMEYSPLVKKEKTLILRDFSGFRVKIRNHWQQDSSLIEKFISYNKKHLNEDDIKILQSWRNITRSSFVILKYYPEYAVFFSMKDKKFYGVLALNDNFTKLIPSKPPVMIETSLLPYKESIIWDGLIEVFEPPANAELPAYLNCVCEEVRTNGDIICTLSSKKRFSFLQMNPNKLLTLLLL